MATGELWIPEARTIELYDWQMEAVEGLRSHIRDRRQQHERDPEGVPPGINLLLASPTGSGKTMMAAYLMDECSRKRKRAVFIADRISLIDQTSATFDRYGIAHGVMQGDHPRHEPWRPIQVISAQTLARRRRPEDIDLIVVDEAHTVHEATRKWIAERGCVCVGLTATPFAKGLGLLYDATVTVRTTNQLIEDGYLAPYRIFAASEPDMAGAKVGRDGEWDEDEAERRSLPIIGDLVAEYKKHAYPKKFIAFAVNVSHAEAIQREMIEAGVPCALYTYRQGDEARAQTLRDFREPDSYLRGLISVSALAKGFDDPTVECVIMARPLRKSLSEHVQILGRGLRRDPENPEKVCTILDHSGNCTRFWGPMQTFFEEGAPPLDMGRKGEKGSKPEKKEREPLKCPECAHVHDGRPSCPMCGFEYPRRSEVEVIAGELQEMGSGSRATREEKQAVYSGLLSIALARGYRTGWVKHKYQEYFGVWPRGLAEIPAPPSVKLEGWVRSRQIAFLKRRAA